MKIGPFIIVLIISTFLVLVLPFLLMWALSAPIVQKDATTEEVVAVITSDGIVRPPSFLEGYKGGYYVEYTAPGYRPVMYGMTEAELRKLQK